VGARRLSWDWAVRNQGPPNCPDKGLCAQRRGFQLRALSEHREAIAGKTGVMVLNHDFEAGTLGEGSPTAPNPKLGGWVLLAEGESGRSHDE
jgi:hypothetical protein